MLRVQEDAPPLPTQERHGVADHLEVLGARGAQRALDVADVRLRDEGDDGRLAVDEGAHERVRRRLAADPSRGTEGRERGVLEREFGGGPGEELRVLGVRAGPATFDEADSEVVEVRRDRELVRHGEVEALLLGTITQGGVVDVQVAHSCRLDLFSCVGFAKTCVSSVAVDLRCCSGGRGCGGRAFCPADSGSPSSTKQKDPPGVGGLRDER